MPETSQKRERTDRCAQIARRPKLRLRARRTLVRDGQSRTKTQVEENRSSLVSAALLEGEAEDLVTQGGRNGESRRCANDEIPAQQNAPRERPIKLICHY